MNIDKVIRLLSTKYGFNYNEAKKYIYNTNNTNNTNNIKDTNNTNTNDIKYTNNTNNTNDKSVIDFELPFYGEIYKDRCQAIVFNHGLLTQCKETCTNQTCSKCKTLKYGLISERLKYNLGNFKTVNGKHEKSYLEYLKSKNISIEQVKEKVSRDVFDIIFNNSQLKGNKKKVEIKEEKDRCRIERSRVDVIVDGADGSIVGRLKKNKIEIDI